MYRTQNNSRGFGLVQMLIVLAIIGIMARIVMSNVSSVRAKARDTQRVSDISEIITALKLYNNDNGHFPCVSGTNDSTETDFLEELVTGGYMTRMPIDPMNNAMYQYRYYSYSDTPSGACGQYGMLNYDTEHPGTGCVFGGKFITSTHCHVPFPGGLPCSDPWDDENGTNNCSTIQD
jgi:general secretion pathway protein G